MCCVVLFTTLVPLFSWFIAHLLKMLASTVLKILQVLSWRITVANFTKNKWHRENMSNMNRMSSFPILLCSPGYPNRSHYFPCSPKVLLYHYFCSWINFHTKKHGRQCMHLKKFRYISREGILTVWFFCAICTAWMTWKHFHWYHSKV